jgi:hypothetical protein
MNLPTIVHKLIKGEDWVTSELCCAGPQSSTKFTDLDPDSIQENLDCSASRFFALRRRRCLVNSSLKLLTVCSRKTPQVIIASPGARLWWSYNIDSAQSFSPVKNSSKKYLLVGCSATQRITNTVNTVYHRQYICQV